MKMTEDMAKENDDSNSMESKMDKLMSKMDESLSKINKLLIGEPISEPSNEDKFSKAFDEYQKSKKVK